ncbi:MAG: hypothetical protein L0H73_15450 [Nitrococcus sp.]|nr:hypothetical protein [Nitrococcus sp.]
MSTDTNELTPAFVERQRDRLEVLRDRLLNDTVRAAAEERDMSQRQGNEVHDAGDEGAIEALRTAAELRSARGTSRLREIERALEKITDGSYGLSDESGDPIGRGRLEAVPEALFTVEEEALRER